jgi:LysM repeat protein
MTDDLGHYYLDTPPGTEGAAPDAAPPDAAPPDAAPSPPGAEASRDAAPPAEGQADPTQWAGSERDVETQSLDRLRFLGGREVATHEPIPLDVPRLLPDAWRPKLHRRLHGLGVASVAAPIVFLVAVFAIVIIAQRTGVGGSTKATHHKSGGSTSTKTAKPARKYYVVKAGESLSQISAKTGVTITQIMDRNPQITDPANLRIGLKIKLPPPSQ